MKLIITNFNGNKINVSHAHGEDFENMEQAVKYLLDNFVMDEISKIELK